MADKSPRLRDTAASMADHEAATAAVDHGKVKLNHKLDRFGYNYIVHRQRLPAY
jgi:hypothetical protein